MAIKTFSLCGANSNEAAQQAQRILDGFQPKLILFFASSQYDDSNPAAELEQAFPGCQIIGSCSHSEYCNDTYTDHSFSVMAMDASSVADLCVRVVEDLPAQPDFRTVVEEMEHHFGGKEEIFDHFDRYVGLVLFDSAAKKEEWFMDRLGMASDLLFVGGSSSAAENGVTHVYANGKTYANAAVLAILKTVNGYDVIKTQSASVFSDRKLEVTRSDLANRVLYEFDHRPCAEVYAEVLGIAPEQVADYFVSNPLGIVSGEGIFVRTFNEVQKEGISLHCGLPEGSEINVLKIGNIVADTKQALDSVITYEPAGVINFNCLYRTFEMLQHDLVQPYCALWGRYPSIGCSTGGEAYLGHINETSTVLVIK